MNVGVQRPPRADEAACVRCSARRSRGAAARRGCRSARTAVGAQRTLQAATEAAAQRVRPDALFRCCAASRLRRLANDTRRRDGVRALATVRAGCTASAPGVLAAGVHAHATRPLPGSASPAALPCVDAHTRRTRRTARA
jgi:hypothetical protein